MTVTVYSSSDAGASGLILTSVPGSLLAILDACLVNGYSGKTAAGWTKSFSSSTIGVYRAATGNQRYLRVDDTHPSYAVVAGFETMTGVNAGTGPFPSAYNIGGGTNQPAQTVSFASAITGSTSTGLTGGTTYTATIVVDTTRVINFSALGSTMSTYTALVAQLNAQLTPYATCALLNGHVVFQTASTVSQYPAQAGISVTNGGATPLFAAVTPAATIGTSGAPVPGNFMIKSTLGNTNPISWMVVATDAAFYMWVNCNQDLNTFALANVSFFGDIVSFKVSDAYNTVLIAASTPVPSGSAFATLSTNLSTAVVGHWLARSFTQLGSCVGCAKHSDQLRGAATMGRGNLAYPNLIDGGLTLAPVWVHEPTNLQTPIRGTMPGIWNICHNLALQHLDTFSGTGALAGKTFLVINSYAGAGAAQFAIETSNTW